MQKLRSNYAELNTIIQGPLKVERERISYEAENIVYRDLG